MKATGMFAACVLAALPMTLLAEEGAKPGSTRSMELEELIARFAKSSGTKFAIDPRVRAQVPLVGIEPEQLTFDQLLALLDVHQFAVRDAGGLVAVVPESNARQFASPIYSDADFKAMDHELVTLLVQPKQVCAAFLVPILRPLMPQSAHLSAEGQTNTLIISDRAKNARRIAGLIDTLDKRGGGRKDCPSPGFANTAGPPAVPATKPGS